MRANIYLFIFCLCLESLSQNLNATPVIQAYNPDNESDLIKLTSWEFCYGKHLSASEMKKLPDKEKLYARTPYSWSDQFVNGHNLPSFGIGTYHLTIRNTKASVNHPIVYGLYVGHIESAYKLFINNKLVGEGGKAETNKANYRPFTLPGPYYFLVTTDSIDIVFHVSHFILPRFGGYTQNIYFGKPKEIERLTLRNSMVVCFLLSLFVLVFIQQTTLSFLNKLEKSHIILSLLCVLFFIKLLADSNALMVFHVISESHIKLYYQIWILSLLSIPLILRLIKISFPKEVNPYIEKGIYWLYALLLIVVITSNLDYITKAGYVFVYISSICIGYFNVVLIRAVIAKRRYSTVHIISLVILVSFFIFDFIHASTANCQGYITLIGMGIYILIQSSTFSFKLTISNKQNIKRSKNLQATNRALESSVRERTKELQTTNLKLSKINTQKDFLISTISHDLMNAFNILLTFSRSLSEDKSLNNDQRTTTQTILKTAENGYLILENMLEWTTLHMTQPFHLKPISQLSDIIRKNIELHNYCINRKKLQIGVDVDDSLHFYCQKDQLNTILRNLISNAVKFSYEQGYIKIKTRQKDGWIQIQIQDQGVGITPEIKDILFSHTNSKKRKGTFGEKGAGIGLLIIQELVESNNGKISCYSKPNRITVFIVEFKLVNAEKDETNIDY